MSVKDKKSLVSPPAPHHLIPALMNSIGTTEENRHPSDGHLLGNMKDDNLSCRQKKARGARRCTRGVISFGPSVTSFPQACAASSGANSRVFPRRNGDHYIGSVFTLCFSFNSRNTSQKYERRSSEQIRVTLLQLNSAPPCCFPKKTAGNRFIPHAQTFNC